VTHSDSELLDLGARSAYLDCEGYSAVNVVESLGYVGWVLKNGVSPGSFNSGALFQSSLNNSRDL
jgi:hypothetical protein